MKILDVSAGNRAIWYDKHDPICTFLDIRAEVSPDVVADSRDLSMFEDSLFDMVVFDPPHVNFGANANMSRTYEHHTTVEIRGIIERTATEASRVVRTDGLMAFKWNDHDQKLGTVLALMPQWRPLFGHKVASRTKHSSSTSWVILLNIGYLETEEESPE